MASIVAWCDIVLLIIEPCGYLDTIYESEGYGSIPYKFAEAV